VIEPLPRVAGHDGGDQLEGLELDLRGHLAEAVFAVGEGAAENADDLLGS